MTFPPENGKHGGTNARQTRAEDEPRSLSLLRADLAALAERFAAANARCLRAQTIESWELAEAERRDLNGEYWSACSEIAHLQLMLLRLALEHEPDALRLYLVEALRPELETLAASIAELEGRRG